MTTPLQHVNELIEKHKLHLDGKIDEEFKNLLVACVESAVHEEREACAKVCDDLRKEFDDKMLGQWCSPDTRLAFSEAASSIRKRDRREALDTLTQLSQEYGLYDDI